MAKTLECSEWTGVYQISGSHPSQSVPHVIPMPGSSIMRYHAEPFIC